MTTFRPKQGGVPPAVDIEFCRGLEELVRGRGCVGAAITSCSTGRNPGEDDDEAAGEGPDQLARSRRRAGVGGEEDPAESPVAHRCQSVILSRWARQAEEMIATMERRNRESELLVPAVSVLNSPFLRESRQDADAGGGGGNSGEEQPGAAPAFSTLQRWRELEGDSAGGQGGSLMSNKSKNGSQNRVETSRGEEDEFCHGPARATPTPRDGEAEERSSSREQSPDLGEGEGERVRQIARGWMTENTVADPRSRVASPRNESSRAELLGETERERVRIVREWVQMASQHSVARVGMREERATDRDQRSRDGSVTDQEEGHPEHIRKDSLRLRGRQARLDFFMRIARERELELQSLSEHRVVSQFSYRNRIQSLLRGRFLRNGIPTEEQRLPSVAARELGQLRQRRSVSGLRDGFCFRSINNVHDQASTQSHASSNHVAGGPRSESNDELQPHTVLELMDDSEHSPSTNEDIVTHLLSDIHWVEPENNNNPDNDDRQDNAAQEECLQEERQDETNGWQHAIEVSNSEWNVETREESDGIWLENMDHISVQELQRGEDGEESRLSEDHGEWFLHAPQEAVENWEKSTSGQMNLESEPIVTANRFVPPDDGSIYSAELRDLLRRRSVSNLLQSGFRESLDRLIQSYIQRQDRSSVEWDLQGDMSSLDTEEEDRGSQGGELNDEEQDASVRSPLVLPLRPQPLPSQVWHQEMHSHNWDQHGLHQAEIEWEIINDLRADIAKLRQDMTHLQRMLETCMDMQLELHKSMKQEVAAALNRVVGELGKKRDDRGWV